MRFTVTMKCEKCGESYVGQAEHLVDAVGNMVKSAYEDDHAGGAMNLELQALGEKATDVNTVDEVLTILGMEPGEVHIVDGPLTQEQFEEFIQKHRDGDKPDG